VAVTDVPIGQVRVAWSGFVGGPGISTHYIPGVTSTTLTALRTMYNGLTGVLPTGVTLTFPTEGDVIQAGTGELVTTWTVASAPAAVVGAGAGAMNSAQGCQIKWVTSDVADGHALKGRTFLVPTAAGVFGTDGLLTASVQATIYAAANALATSATPWHVWHRPVYAPHEPGTPRGAPTRAGGTAPITGCAIPRKAVVLTSRRD
jgi:hypothetical protein